MSSRDKLDSFLLLDSSLYRFVGVIRLGYSIFAPYFSFEASSLFYACLPRVRASLACSECLLWRLSFCPDRRCSAGFASVAHKDVRDVRVVSLSPFFENATVGNDLVAD